MATRAPKVVLTQREFPKIRGAVPYLGVLIIWILLFWVPYYPASLCNFAKVLSG